MEFNDILHLRGIDPASVALALHKPTSPAERRALCALVEEDPEAFDAYQSTHPAIQQATVRSRALMASFVPTGDGEFTFVGLFERSGEVPILEGDLDGDEPFVRMLMKSGHRTREDALGLLPHFVGRLRFELPRVRPLDEVRGRLVARDPEGRNHMRLAEKTTLDVVEIGRKAQIAPPMPPWDQVVVMSMEVRDLPRDWAVRLSEWRGIYLIVDQTDGARYVGAAYGATNLLGRWQAHVAGDMGVTKELSRRGTERYRFSILELLSPVAEAEEVIARERTWMQRLDTLKNGLNN